MRRGSAFDLPNAPPTGHRRVRPKFTMLVAACAILWLGALAACAADTEKIAPPEEITLQTRDGVTLAATYYRSNQAKGAVPVILLHGSKGTRADFSSLALALQGAGHAAIAPDLRGHGQSAHATDRLTDLRTADYVAMVDRAGDMEAVKNFLMEKNNAGELNIEKLCIIAVEMSSVIAINWAMLDWSWPQLTTGKQGQDVKALVLVSPEWSIKGLRINDALADPNVRSNLSVLIIAGKNGKAMQDAKRLHNSLQRYHPTPPTEEAAEKQTLWLRTPATSLQGTSLLGEKSLKIDQMIARFIEMRLSKQPLPWRERRSPLK